MAGEIKMYRKLIFEENDGAGLNDKIEFDEGMYGEFDLEIQSKKMKYDFLYKNLCANLKMLKYTEHKGSILFTSIGVILALLVPLLALVYKIVHESDVFSYFNGWNSNWLIILMTIMFIPVLGLLGVALGFAHGVSAVTTYTLPFGKSILDWLDDDEDDETLYKDQIHLLRISLNDVDGYQMNKAKKLKIAQILFLLGVIVLIFLLFLTMIVVCVYE